MTMELSQSRYKVYHNAGKSMGHVGGLSRLYTATINALTVEDFLDEAEYDVEDFPMDNVDSSDGAFLKSPLEARRVDQSRSGRTPPLKLKRTALSNSGRAIQARFS
ncbi:hypothetical protein JG687_00016321 [Phytophthora cactorum]|uniref:Uncharacterized protein n=1 Tax=Phytophthora cactorum TaxID=29920 RepID=A0A329RG21_9STRA|nr:hypothetical protein Pcac1_g3477 [Phytophthora cactorum]KAG2810762.1 hypothetical protein PC111_g15509 [Phytophthora cactorum]KAG2827316.1 hypothetical protein PC112_g8908 [Phytophthora cactorum]KAG2850529.1 hypothetical protein PC113_g16703 [Phytophthora cactorum]KAG2900830.1 hypothetical protein PC115_g16061 [Phytophthora cactorum]